MTNFDHFLSDPQLVPFTEAAVAAERIFHIDLSQCVIAAGPWNLPSSGCTPLTADWSCPTTTGW